MRPARISIMTVVGKKRLLQFSVLILAAEAATGLLLKVAMRLGSRCLNACLAQHQCDLDFSHPDEMHSDCLIIQEPMQRAVRRG